MCAKRNDHQIAIDDALTKELNRHDPIHDHMVRCTAFLHHRFKDDPRVSFYVKGSAALSRYLRKWGVPDSTVDEICARSDWDTQLLINPWLSRAEWFGAFLDCQKTIRECLDQFEEELLGVLTPLFLPTVRADGPILAGKTNDHEVRRQQNLLAASLREAIGRYFGEIFLNTSRANGFATADHPKFWKLAWDNIVALETGGRLKDLLELDVQSHGQATLTSAMIHPAQALDNLNSVMTGEQLRLLQETTRAVAAATWDRLSTASDDYDRLRMTFIADRPDVVAFLKKKVLELQSDLVLINSLPEQVIGETIGLFDRAEREELTELWDRVRQAKLRQAIAGDGGSEFEVDFGRTLIAALKRHVQAAQRLQQWCLDNIALQPEMVTRLADLYHAEILPLFTVEQQMALTLAQQEIDAQFELYHEEPDPEDVAEAEKRETERLAPFTLVSQEKGGRKLGSIVENMTIREFYLYRLMIRCQLSNRDPDHRLTPDAPPDTTFDAFKQQFKFRAELLDISVPRDDSVETAEQWVHTRRHIALHDGIPLPDGDYFMDEYLLMFREVLDRKSSSLHKLTKRLKRACLIAEVFAVELQRTERWEARLKDLSVRYPKFQAMVQDLTVAPANLAVFMRMCEQLVESYDLAHNEKLRADSELMMDAFATDLRRILSTRLTDKTLGELMQIYARLGSLVYHHSFLLAHIRQRQLGNDKLVKLGQDILGQVSAAFGHDTRRFRAAVVEDFAIAAEPDLPASLKQSLPLDVLKIIVYAGTAAQPTLQHLVPALAESIRGGGGHFDVVFDNGVLFGRIVQHSDASTDQHRMGAAGRAVFVKVEFVFDDNTDNWVAPGHERDLKAIIKHYRRALPRHTEYHIVAQKKNILRQMETALTTY